MMTFTMMMRTSMMMGGVNLKGYTPYGYGVEIQNQFMEFATESDMIEWLKENGYEYDDDTDIQVC